MSATESGAGEREAWVDRHGDVWTEGVDGLLHTPETRPFEREYVERKWGPLRTVAYPSYLGPATPDADDASEHRRRHHRCGLGDPSMCGHPDCPDMPTPAASTDASGALRQRAEAFLVQCGSCDGGLPMVCACNDGDPRPVIADLLDALDRESAAATRARAEGWDEGEWAGRQNAAEVQRVAHWSHIGSSIPHLIQNPHAARRGDA